MLLLAMYTQKLGFRKNYQISPKYYPKLEEQLRDFTMHKS